MTCVMPNPFSLAAGHPSAERAHSAVSASHDMCRSILDDIISSIFPNADTATVAAPCAVVPIPAAEDVESTCKSILSTLVSKVADQLGPKVATTIKNENAVIRDLKRYANRAVPSPTYTVVKPMLGVAYQYTRRPTFAKRLFDDRAALAGLMRLAFPSALRCIVMVMQHEPKLSGAIFETGKWKSILRMGTSSDPAERADAQFGVNILCHTLKEPFGQAFFAADGIDHFLACAFADHWGSAAFSFAGLDNIKKIQVRAAPLCSAMRAPLLTDRVPLRLCRRCGHPFSTLG
jgi:hypothetical protein